MEGVPSYPDWSLIIVLFVLNLPVYVGLGWLLFRDWDEFLEAILYWLTPDCWSFLQGEFLNDWWAELKLGFLFTIGFFLTFWEYRFVLETWGPLHLELFL